MNILVEEGFCSPALGKETSDRIGRELSKLERTNGTLTPDAVVEAARKNTSPLHAHFTWDNSEAAHKYRLVQAAWLIRTVKVKVVVGKTTENTRAFVRVSTEEQPTGHYVNLSAALNNPSWREQMLTQALAELECLRRKYSVLHELRKVFHAIDGAVARKGKRAA